MLNNPIVLDEKYRFHQESINQPTFSLTVPGLYRYAYFYGSCEKTDLTSVVYSGFVTPISTSGVLHYSGDVVAQDVINYSEASFTFTDNSTTLTLSANAGIKRWITISGHFIP